MKPRMIIAVGLLAISAAILIWLNWSNPPAAEKFQPVAASKPALVPAASAQVVAPVAAPTPAGAREDAVPVEAQALTGNPQAELKTAIPYFIQLIKSGNTEAYFNLVYPPAVQQQMSLEVRAKCDKQVNQFVLGPDGQAAVQLLESLKDREPTLRPEGFVAYYKTPNLGGTETLAVVFTKTDGLWAPNNLSFMPTRIFYEDPPAGNK